MEFLRKKRRLAALGVVAAALAGATLFVVLPALASTAGQAVLPASTAGVTPDDYAIGGQSGICATLFPGFAGTEYDISNPKTTKQPLNLGNGVKLNIVMDPPNSGGPVSGLWPAYGNDKYFSFDSLGTAAFVGVGVNGGADTTRYNYATGTAAGFVTKDGYLHAPAQSWDAGTGEPTQLYSVSHLTFCYGALSSVSGTVYQDADQNGSFNAGVPPDSALPNWTVRLYKGVTPGTPDTGSLFGTATTDGTGKYHFDNVPADGSHYRLCEVPGTPPPSPDNVWFETQPPPSAATICDVGASELRKGYDFTPTSSGFTGDFGNVGAITCTPGTPFGIPNYQIGTCKPTQTYVFNAGTLNGAPYVSYWVGDSSLPPVPTVEKLTFQDPFVAGSPKYTKLLYSDTSTFPLPLGATLNPMQYCKVDPRTDSGFTLGTSYDEYGAESAAVLPGIETSCVISIKITAPGTLGGSGTLEFYVYSLSDSIRSSG